MITFVDDKPRRPRPVFLTLFLFAFAAVRRIPERDDDREMFANDVFEVASRRNAPVGVDDESFFGCFQVVLVVLVVTSNGHVIGDVVVENVPNGKTFRSLEFFFSTLSIHHFYRYRPRATRSSVHATIFAKIIERNREVSKRRNRRFGENTFGKHGERFRSVHS